MINVTHVERWHAKYNEVIEFINTNHRNPSRYRIEVHDMLNWLKAKRKLMNAGEMKTERVEMFRELMRLVEENKIVNQYA